MDLFPDGAFVQLRSRANRKYVHADGDWEGVSLRSRGSAPSLELEAVWQVEHWVHQGTTFLRLQGAAYGRYLSLSAEQAPPGHRGLKAVQCDLDEPNMVNIYLWRWRVERVHPLQDYVRLRHFDRDLRANGRFRRWNTGVTVDVNRGRRLTTMMQWTVHPVAATPVPMPLPAAPQHQVRGFAIVSPSLHCIGMLFLHVPGIYQLPPREIRHVRASDEGNFDQNHHNWPSFDIYDYSVFNLRIQLGQLQHDWDGEMFGFTLCMRPGSHGRLMPLVTNLPRSLEPMYIVVFRTGSPAAAALVYPVL
ncbi:uncharacterized protein [Miscanthus floridulus]|uniref:uncharacterized protein n=1 Tax=Miscanthus floridulus TaxID=154761 RepID=UPI00345ADD52